MKKQMLLFLTMLLPLGVYADLAKIDGIYYNLSDDAETYAAEVTSNPNQYTGNVVIPESVIYGGNVYTVTSIGNNAFTGCSGLTSVTLPSTAISIGDFAFSGCPGLTSMIIPNSVETIGQSAFYGCSGLITVTIPNSVTSIGNYAFTDCSSLTSITIPNKVSIISWGTFSRCSGLGSVIIPNSVTIISTDAFEFCSNLTSITIPNSVTTIREGAFRGCTGLTSITIPNSVTSVGPNAFNSCSGLSSITIGNGITNIDSYAFSECPNFTDFYCYAKTIPETNSNVFSNSYIKYSTLHVPPSAIQLYMTTEPWKEFGSIVKLEGDLPNTPKCATPTINYSGGTLTFYSKTEGTEYVYEITDPDIRMGFNREVALTATYTISVYATKAGYENSEVATATLCWISSEPSKEGISDDVINVAAQAVMIQSEGGVLNIKGAEDGTRINVYTISGVQVGSSVSEYGQAQVQTDLRPGSIAVVKIGKKAVKVVVK